MDYRILSDNDCARMRDAELINSMLILLLEGVVEETPTSIDNIYKKYDKEFAESECVERKFSAIMDVLEQVYSYFNGTIGVFDNKNYFFTLYCVVANQMYGIPDSALGRVDIFADTCIIDNVTAFNFCVAQFINDYEANIEDKDNTYGLYHEFSEFAKNHKIRTTSRGERIQRITFLNNNIERVANYGQT